MASFIIVLRVIFLDEDFMNIKLEIEKVLTDRIEVENRNTFFGMGIQLILGQDLDQDQDSPSSLQVSILRANNHQR